MTNDFEKKFLRGASIDEIIQSRTEVGKKLAARFHDLPAGLTYTEFMQHPEIEMLDLDFVTSSEMFNEYEQLHKP